MAISLYWCAILSGALVIGALAAATFLYATRKPKKPASPLAIAPDTQDAYWRNQPAQRAVSERLERRDALAQSARLGTLVGASPAGVFATTRNVDDDKTPIMKQSTLSEVIEMTEKIQPTQNEVRTDEPRS